MIIQSSDKWVVLNTETKAVISEHPYTDNYTKGKAKESALKSNDDWKAGK